MRRALHPYSSGLDGYFFTHTPTLQERFAPCRRSRGRFAGAGDRVPAKRSKQAEPNNAGLRSSPWVGCAKRGYPGRWRDGTTGSRLNDFRRTEGPTSIQCAETFLRHGKGSLAIARSGTVWARRCGRSMSRTSRRIFPRISQTCSNGWTNANGVRGGLRHAHPALHDDHRAFARTLRLSAPRRSTGPMNFPNSREARLLAAAREWLAY